MPRRDLFGTTAFRWAVVFAAAFTGLSLILFAFVYWQTAGYERNQLDAMLRHEADLIAADPQGAVVALTVWLKEDLHSARYGMLIDHDGTKQAGNMPAMPGDLWPDGRPQFVSTEAHDEDGDERSESIRALVLKLPDGQILALGNDTDKLEHVQNVILRALGLGLGPMVLLSLVGGAVLGRRALGRVTALDHAIADIRRGRLSGRLPLVGTGDEFDRLAGGINAMMDEIERLLEEVRGVGDSIAHDLRTPLTRARTRLERSRDTVKTPAEFAAAIDDTLNWLDQTFAIITAVLRIGEIEHGRRRAAFQQVDLAPILAEAAELYDPIAEERQIAVRVDVEARCTATSGDRDLIFEAVVNLLDNAIKFTPREGHVRLSLVDQAEDVVIIVGDDGPGIATAERKQVLQRFYRAERSRRCEGTGLGLSLVAAIATLHGFRLTIGDNEPGCRIELACPSSTAAVRKDDTSIIQSIELLRYD